ncbi:MAG: inositol monophosphatase family protein [Solirubrobacteraceae bacterium]
MPTLEEDLALALALADLADSITIERFGATDLAVETKPDLTPVTDADRAVELALRERIAAARPSDAVLGEEYGVTGGAGRRRWIIDPIDGTKSYLRGMATWSTLIALELDGAIVLGVVAMPVLGRRWWGSRGGGAFADGRPIRVSGIASLADAQLAWSGIQEWDEVDRLDQLIALGRACWRTRGVGDSWQYMLVAEGAAEIALDPSVSLWDLAALKVIIEEAGGRFTDLGGIERADGGSGIATNGLVHDAALAVVGTERAGG